MSNKNEKINPDKLIERFSTHLKKTLSRAMSLATSMEHNFVSPFHIIMAILQEKGSLAFEILRKHEIKEKDLMSILNYLPKIKNSDKKTLSALIPDLDTTAKKATEKAIIIAYEYEHNHVGTEHLLSALLDLREVQIFFEKNNLNIKNIKTEVKNLLENNSKFPDIEEMKKIMSDIEEINPEDIPPSMGMGPESNPILGPNSLFANKKSGFDNFTTDLVKKQKQIDPVIGREKEINRIINILSRRNKNNPILIGEPGVGKTAIVEGLAKKIAEGDVPLSLKGKKILSLDMSMLIAGTIYRGEFESRLKNLVDKISKNPKIILFIDEIHNIIGAGSSQGAMDAANILKPALARGELRCIGATTLDEYKKHISRDPALERRFQSVNIEEPTETETIQIIKGVKKYYENYHNTKINDEAILSAVELSNRFIHDNFQPDKSIDLIDEACAFVKINKKPNQLDEKQNQLQQKLEELFDEKEEHIKNERLEQALKIKKQIQKTEKELNKIAKEKKKEKEPKKIVGKKHIMQVLSDRIGVDREKLEKNEWQNLKDIQKNIKSKIIGQDQIIDQIIQKIARVKLSKNEQRPLASFLFVGSSGVGKTELAKMLAHELYNDKNALIKLDMSEFSESHSTAKLLGSPAGYVGHSDRNYFLEKIQKKPYCVILFDEIDKAHNDVTRLLLQILDEGEISDARGKKIKFNHSIIILTSNLGSEFFKGADIGFGLNKIEDHANIIKKIKSKVKEVLSPALLDRLDLLQVFNGLNMLDIEKISKLKIEQINNDLKNDQDIKIKMDEEVIKHLIQNTYNPEFGARLINKKIEDIIYDLVLEKITKTKKLSKKIYSVEKEKNYYKLV